MALRLCDLDPEAGLLAIACEPCARRGRYRLATLIASHGPRAELPDVLRLLAAKGGCPASLNPPRACRARFLNLPERRRAFASGDLWDP